jgi:hypothetical protein
VGDDVIDDGFSFDFSFDGVRFFYFGVGEPFEEFPSGFLIF